MEKQEARQPDGSLAEDVVVRLRDLLASPDIRAGGRLPPERTLAGQLGVGRRSLRNALEQLESAGEISRQRGRGTFLKLAASKEEESAFGLADIKEYTNPLEAIELRLAMEPMAARLAALRASRCDIKALWEAAEASESARDSEVYETADRAFHRRIVKASRNTLFLTLFDFLAGCWQDKSWRRLGETAHCYKRQSVHVAFHREIAEALAARDGERAADALARHLSDIQRHIAQHATPRHLS